MGKQGRTDLLIQKMKAKNYDPLASLIDIAMDSETPLDQRIDCHKILAKHSYPTLKSVDMEASVSTVFNIQLQDYAAKLVEKNNVTPLKGTTNESSTAVLGDGSGRNQLTSRESVSSSDGETNVGDASEVSATPKSAEA